MGMNVLAAGCCPFNTKPIAPNVTRLGVSKLFFERGFKTKIK